jgi:protein-disulfide isomerase
MAWKRTRERETEREMSRLSREVSEADHGQGPPDARVTLVEYGDFECPHCGAAYPELKAVQRTMGDALRFVFRHFPLSGAHPHAHQAAEFAEAAATIGRFWEMHAVLFENQQALDEQSLVGYAGTLGCDATLIESALRGAFAERVRRDFSGGVRSGVNGTPCLFINGQRYEGVLDSPTLIHALRARI